MPMSRRNFLIDDAPATANPFLRGNFAPVREKATADDLKVVGELPPEMDGMFVRNGPNPQFPPIKNYHVFEGDGMLHGVRIQNGSASYRNRYIQTTYWKAERAVLSRLADSMLPLFRESSKDNYVKVACLTRISTRQGKHRLPSECSLDSEKLVLSYPYKS